MSRAASGPRTWSTFASSGCRIGSVTPRRIARRCRMVAKSSPWPVEETVSRLLQVLQSRKASMSFWPRLLVVAALAALVGSPAVASTASDRTLDVPILMYHRIDYLRPTLPAITLRLTVDPGAFARQMAWLAGHGYPPPPHHQLPPPLRSPP